MKRFGIGLGIGLLGLVIASLCLILWPVTEITKGVQPWFRDPLAALGFTVMFLGPLTFWVILPIKKSMMQKK